MEHEGAYPPLQFRVCHFIHNGNYGIYKTQWPFLLISAKFTVADKGQVYFDFVEALFTSSGSKSS